MRAPRFRRGLSAAVLAALAAAAILSPTAAADRIYWGNEAASRISFATLGGGGGGDLPLTGVGFPQGLAIDSAAGRIYWTRYAGIDEGVRVSNFDGSGAAMINTAGATVNSIYGLAIDPAGGRVYWANVPAGPDDISYARLDGSGGGNLNTSGATELDNPFGVAVDPAGGRVYWANGTNQISFARLDESGGGDVDTTGATVGNPRGVAVDPAAGRVYWANGTPPAISFANLDGSGAADVNTAGATVKSPMGVAIDHDGGRVYWANETTGVISYANLDGTGGGDIDTTGASPGEATFPILHLAPTVARAPDLSASRRPGSHLSCTQGEWAADVVAAFLFRVPRTFAYSWTRDGAAVPGADSAMLSPDMPGEYRCAITASNDAGSTTGVSPARRIETAAVAGLRIRPRAFLAARRHHSAGASAHKGRPRRGARVRFRLNEPARVVFRVKRLRRGRRPRLLRGRLVRVGGSGVNRFRFNGRLRGRSLSPGRYVLTATPRGVGKPGRTRSAGFRIARPGR